MLLPVSAALMLEGRPRVRSGPLLSGTLQHNMFTLLDLRMSSLHMGHANILRIVPILMDVPRRASKHRRLARKLPPPPTEGRSLSQRGESAAGIMKSSSSFGGRSRFCEAWLRPPSNGMPFG